MVIQMDHYMLSILACKHGSWVTPISIQVAIRTISKANPHSPHQDVQHIDRYKSYLADPLGYQHIVDI
jgi:hypothetical protein